MSRGIVLSLVQLDFGYNSAVTTVNSVLVLALVATKCNPTEAICYV